MNKAAILMATVLVGLLTASHPHADDDAALDKFKGSDAGAWSCAKSIAIARLGVPEDFRGKMPAEDYVSAFINRLAQGIRAMPGVTEVILAKPGEAPAADILIEGEFTDLTTGSRAARFWVGFGAGRSKCGVRLHASTVETQKAVFELEHARISAAGLGSDELMENIDETAADIVRALSQERGACPDAGIFPMRSLPKGAAPESTKTALDSEPPSAEAYIDGKFVGNTPIASYPISAGRHQIEYRKTGYVVWSKEVEVVEGASTRFFGSLEMERPAQVSPQSNETPAPSAPLPSTLRSEEKK